MKQFTLYLEDELVTNLDDYKRLRRTRNSTQAIREILFYFFDTNTDKSVFIYPLSTPRLPEDLLVQAADLPGMTAEVIKSHLVRFPKVTPELYKGIIEELRQRQQTEEGLKNPEAAAYGLCKRIQNGGRKIGAQQEHDEVNATIDNAPDPFAVY